MKNTKMKLIQIPDQPFEMQTTQVTQELYKKVTGVDPSYFKGKNLPVERVSWWDAIKFCNRVSELQGLEPCYEISDSETQVHWNKCHDGFRLPTEKEWEHAYRAGRTTDPAGRELLEQAWCYENSGGRTHPVGKKKPNAWGLYDMLGNVWEWCSDLWEPNYSYRVYRGGSWLYPAGYLRAGLRRRVAPGSRFYSLGIRCARSTAL